MGIQTNYPNRYTARFAPLRYWDDPDSTKRGFIPVEFEDEIVWARPIFGLGSFSVPTKEFVEKNRDSVAVVVEVLDNQEGKLAWSGFTYWRNSTPEETQEQYPHQKILYEDEAWKIFLNTHPENPTFLVENQDGTHLQLHREPDKRKIEYVDGQLGHAILLGEDTVTVKDGVNNITVQTSDQGLKITDNVNDSSFEIGPEGIIVQDGNDHTQLQSGKISLGRGQGQKEPVILGRKLVTMMQTILEALANHTHPTSVGPSGPPINHAVFSQQRGQTEALKSNVSETE